MGIQHTYWCALCAVIFGFPKEKHPLCLPMTPQLSQPTSPSWQHRAKLGTAEDKGLLHRLQHLTPGAEEENSSIWGLS